MEDFEQLLSKFPQSGPITPQEHELIFTMTNQSLSADKIYKEVIS